MEVFNHQGKQGLFRDLPVAASGGVSDGDKGSITVSSSGSVWTIDNGAVTNAMLADDAVDSDELAAGAVDNAQLNTMDARVQALEVKIDKLMSHFGVK